MKNIVRCEDGKYRWTYEFRMLKNPMILLTVLRIFALIFLGLGVFLLLLELIEGHFSLSSLSGIGIPMLILFGVFAVLTVLSYLILAAIYGWTYCVLFEMDETGVRHIQMEKQFKKAQALSWLTAMAGAAAGNIGAVGTGLLAGTKNSQNTDFARVRKMRVYRRFGTVKLDAPFSHNQIYAEKEDLDFVIDYIGARIPKKENK